MNYSMLAAASLLAISSPVVAKTSVIGTDAGAPSGNFGTPQNTARAGYTLSFNDGGNNVFGQIVQTGGVSDGAFANLYFDLNPSVNDGSDLGFEMGASGVTAFVAGANGMPGFSTSISSSLYTFSANTTAGLTTIDYSLSKSLFTGPIAGLIYFPGQTFEDNITLRISQSLSYTAAGGSSYGADRFGNVSLLAGNVPEPAAWAMMLAGFGGIGFAMRRRAKVTVRFA